jgi:hypoxanthine phosphoribosyltransferase
MDVLKPTWTEYAILVEHLYQKIQPEYPPDFVIGISSGGLVPALILHKCFNVPLAVMAAQSYELSETGRQDRRGEVKVGCNLAVVDPNLHGRLLLVDDLTDSGETLQYCYRWLRETYQQQVSAVRTAVVYHKSISCFTPTYLAQRVELNSQGEMPWIEQPWEIYERQAPAISGQR